MAVTTITSGINPEKGITYSAITETSVDWTGVSNSTYFYNLEDDLPYYKNSGGTVVSIFGEAGSDTNYFTTGATLINGTVYFDRNDTLSAYTLDISSVNSGDTFVTGTSFSNNTLTLTRNDDTSIDILLNNFSGLTVNGNVDVVGTMSATTVDGLSVLSGGTDLLTLFKPIGVSDNDTYLTGSTFTNNILALKNNTGGTINTLIDNLSGLTVGNTITSGVLSATTISGNTIYSGGTDLLDLFAPAGSDTNTYITGMTFNPATYEVTSTRNDGFTTAPINLSVLSSDVNITGGTYDINTGVVTFTNNTGGTFGVTGFTSGMTNSYTTAANLIGNTISFDNNVEGADFYNVDLSPLFTANTDTYLTGSTFVNNILSLKNNTGGTVNTLIDNLSGLTVGNTINTGILSAVTVNGNSILSGGTDLIDIFKPIGSGDNDTYLTGSTFTNNILSLKNNTGGTVNTLIDNLSGLTVGNTINTGILSAVTVNGNSILSGGTNLTDIFKPIGAGDNDTYLTGSTFTNNILALKNNTGGTVNTLIDNFSGITSTGDIKSSTNVTAGGNVVATGSGVFGGSILSGGTDLLSIFSTGGGGETNTASNVGTGIGVFNTKSGVDLQFKSLISTGNTMLITTTGNTVNLDVKASGITNSKLASMSGQTFKGNYYGGSTTPQDLSVAQVKAMLAAPRVVSTTSTATLTVNAGITDISILTAQAAALTVAAPTGSPSQGQKLTIRIKDNGTARAITWNAIFRAIGTTLPTTTVISKTVYVGFIYNSTDTKWDCVAVAQEA